MNDADRYITDYAVGLGVDRARTTIARVTATLQAVLPEILAAHRADVLREAANEIMVAKDLGGSVLLQVVEQLHLMAARRCRDE